MELNKQDTVKKYALHSSDTGSPEVQVALLTERINKLTEHFKVNVKDFAGRRGMMRLVSRRRSLLNYLQRESNERYLKLISSLNLRK